MFDLFPPTHWTWWIAGIVLVILEVFAPGAVFLWLGVAAGVVGVVLLIWPSLGWEFQFLIFAVLSVAAIAVFRFWLRKNPIETDRPQLNRRGSQYIGRVFTLAEPIRDGRGRLHVDDTMWKIEGNDVAAGTQIRVTGVDGVVLKVEPAAAGEATAETA
ncbi:MAG: NfeD family protein [Alphaproteobacteria bacterium]